MEEKDIDKLFRDAFIQAEETPHEGIWQGIANKLDNPVIVTSLPRKRNWKIYAAAAVFLMIGIGVYLSFTKNNQSHLTELDSTKITASTPVESQPSAKNEIITSDVEHHIATETPQSLKKEPLTRENIRIAHHEVAEQKHANITLVQDASENQLSLSKIDIDMALAGAPLYRQVTEIEDIKPLIEFEEESETMLASASPEKKESKHIITTLLNTITDNIDSKSAKEVRFYSDDEGSFGVSILNSIAKNPTKKRK